jgi:hypothetical protein
MLTKLVWQRSHQGTMADRTKAIAHYRQHIENVKSAVPADRLLVFSADQGWDPLCEFLDVPLPEGAFPSANDRAFFQKNKAGVAIAAYCIIAMATLAVGAALYGAARWAGL